VVAEGVSEEQDEEGPRNVITGERTRQDFKPLERVDLTAEMRNVEAEVAHAMGSAGTATPAHVMVVNATRAADYRKLLAEKTTVRQAFVLAEIIGAPKASN
jgi:hypothetical protein